MITFWVSGEPTPKQSYRHSKHGNYQPERVRDWQELLGWKAKEAFKGDPLTGQIALDLTFYRKSKRVCDIDNLSKTVLDALEGILFENDNQIAELHIYKLPARMSDDGPGVQITVGVYSYEP